MRKRRIRGNIESYFTESENIDSLLYYYFTKIFGNIKTISYLCTII